VARSERLNKLGDSWFSSKAIEVAPREWLLEVEHCFGKGAVMAYQADANSEYRLTSITGDTRWVLTSIVKRETTQTYS
jgi:hypothetical protein